MLVLVKVNDILVKKVEESKKIINSIGSRLKKAANRILFSRFFTFFY